MAPSSSASSRETRRRTRRTTRGPLSGARAATPPSAKAFSVGRRLAGRWQRPWWTTGTLQGCQPQSWHAPSTRVRPRAVLATAAGEPCSFRRPSHTPFPRPFTAYFHADGRVRGKVGSLQMFVQAEGSADDYGPGLFSVEAVQRVAQLDLRCAGAREWEGRTSPPTHRARPALATTHPSLWLRERRILNSDRNGENLLVVRHGRDGERQLCPIDHGYCLPDRLELDYFSLQWRNWRQAKVRLRSHPTPVPCCTHPAGDDGLLRACRRSAAPLWWSTCAVSTWTRTRGSWRRCSTFAGPASCAWRYRSPLRCRHPLLPLPPSHWRGCAAVSFAWQAAWCGRLPSAGSPSPR